MIDYTEIVTVSSSLQLHTQSTDDLTVRNDLIVDLIVTLIVIVNQRKDWTGNTCLFKTP